MTGAGLAGDRRLVDRSNALDHLSVRGDGISGLDQDEIADLEVGAGHLLEISSICFGQELGLRLRALASQGVGLSLATTFGDGFRKVGEQHGEPEPKNDLELECDVLSARHEIADQDHGRERRDDLEHEHDGILHERPRIELDERRTDRRDHDLRVEQGRHRHLFANVGGFHRRNSEVSSTRTRCRHSSPAVRRLGRVRAPGRT